MPICISLSDKNVPSTQPLPIPQDIYRFLSKLFKRRGAVLFSLNVCGLVPIHHHHEMESHLRE